MPMSIFCGCFTPRRKTSTDDKSNTVVRRPYIEPLASPINLYDVSSTEPFPVLDLDSNGNLRTVPSPQSSAHTVVSNGPTQDTALGANDTINEPSHGSPMQRHASAKSRRSLLSHLSLESLGLKRRSRLEISRAEGDVARRKELKKIRLRRIFDEVHGPHGPHNGLDCSFRSRWLAEGSIHSQPELPRHPILFSLPSSPFSVTEERPRSNSCPPVVRRHSVALDLVHHQQLIHRYSPEKTRSFVWDRVQQIENLERSARGVGGPSYAPNSSQLPNIRQSDQGLFSRLEDKSTKKPVSIGGPQVNDHGYNTKGDNSGRRIHTVPSLTSEMSRGTAGTLGRSDDDGQSRFNDNESLSRYPVFPSDSPSTHVASQVDLRELRVPRDNIVPIVLPPSPTGIKPSVFLPLKPYNQSRSVSGADQHSKCIRPARLHSKGESQQLRLVKQHNPQLLDRLNFAPQRQLSGQTFGGNTNSRSASKQCSSDEGDNDKENMPPQSHDISARASPQTESIAPADDVLTPKPTLLSPKPRVHSGVGLALSENVHNCDRSQFRYRVSSAQLPPPTFKRRSTTRSSSESFVHVQRHPRKETRPIVVPGLQSFDHGEVCESMVVRGTTLVDNHVTANQQLSRSSSLSGSRASSDAGSQMPTLRTLITGSDLASEEHQMVAA